MRASILIIDDDDDIRNLFLKALAGEDYNVDGVNSGEEGLAALELKRYDVVFTDLIMPQMSGQEIVNRIKKKSSSLEVIVITGYGTVEKAVSAMKAGAYDFILKPLNFDHINIVLKRCLEEMGLKKEGNKLRKIAQNLSSVAMERYHFGKVIGKNHRMQEIYQLVKSISNIDATALITGETGTGKGLLARTIHFNSNRRNFSLITVDCGAIPETLLESELFGYEKGSFTGATKRRIGKFEQAHRGTIFIDEIGDISSLMQQKLLRVLQDRVFERIGGEATIEVDVRVVAATNKDLKKEVDERRFREDLYYRLNIIPIYLPPLRERLDDLLLLVTHFLEKYREKLKKDVRTISQEAINAMLRYYWPGNIRELENLIERAIIMAPGKDIMKIDIPGERRGKGLYSFGKIDVSQPLKVVKGRVVEEVEKKYLGELLKKSQGNINMVARQAQIDNKTLYEKMRKYGLRKEDFKSILPEETMVNMG